MEAQHRDVSTTTTQAGSGKVSTAMSMINRLRDRRNANRQSRAIDRALRMAPTQAMRDEILVIAQRYEH
jgi:hypothetical protein